MTIKITRPSASAEGRTSCSVPGHPEGRLSDDGRTFYCSACDATFPVHRADTLPQFLGLLDKVKEERDGWLCRCPAHDDAKASLRVTVSEDSGKVLLKCRAGCTNAAVMDALGMTLADLAGMTVDPAEAAHTTSSTDELADDTEIAALGAQLDSWAADLDGPLGDEALAYAARRFGIEPDTARRLGLGVTASLGGGPRLVVPFRDLAGRAIGFQARAIHDVAGLRWKGPESPERASWSRIGFFRGAAGWDEVIVTEGPGDALTAVATGYDALAIRGAGIVQNEATLDRVAEMLRGRVAVIAGDGDAAGIQFTTRLAEELGSRGIMVKTMVMRKGTDLTDWRMEDPGWFARRFADEVAKLSAQTKDEARAARWGSYPFADVGGAQYIRDKLAAEGRPIRYADAAGFFQLENGVWTQQGDGDIRTIVQGLGNDLKLIYQAAQKEHARTEDDQKKSILSNVMSAAWEYKKIAETTRGIDAVMKELKSAAGIRIDVADFDRHPHLLAVRNGVIDLRTGELLPHDPSYLITRRVDLNFRPGAVAARWMAFLNEVFPDQPAMPAFMQRVVGYGITGESSEQCFVVLYGTGANGKSIFTDVLMTIFDAIATTTPFSTFEARRGDGIPNDLAALAGARLVVAPEGNQGKLMDEALLKRVTGQDKITARFLRREFFDFKPQFLLIMASNYRPAFKGQDEGLWRRVKLIEWRRWFSPAERDPELGDKLLAEAEGILAWAVAGAVEWYRAGLQEPEVITAVTDEYRKQSDVLGDFLSESTDSVYTKGTAEDWVPRTQLFRDFQDWADEGNFRDLAAWSSRAFYRAVEERGYPASRRNGVIGFKKIVRSQVDPWGSPTTVEVGAPEGQAPMQGPSLEGGVWDA